MTQDSLKKAIAAAQQRLESLLHRVQAESTELLQEAIAEVSQHLEELQVLAEELEAQNNELTATREAIEADRQRYQTLFNSASDAYLITNAAGIIQEANPAAAFLLKTELSFLVGKPLVVFVHPQQRRKFRQILTQLGQQEQIRDEELQIFLRRKKVNFPAELTGVVMRDTQGNLQSLCFLLRDISDRKQAQESANLVRTIVESEPECVKLVARDGTLLDMNPAGLAMIEAESLAQVQGKSIYPFVVSDYRKAFQALTERVFQGESGILEFEILGLKGTRRWLETHATPFRNNKGEIGAVLSVTRDISDRKRIETALAASEQQLRGIINSAGAAIAHLRIYANHTWQQEFYSAGTLQLFGYTPEEMAANNRLWFDSIHPEDLNNVILPKFEQIFSETAISYEYRFRHRNGEWIWVSETLTSNRDESLDCWLVTCIAFDISAKKQAENKLAKMTTAMSHALEGISLLDTQGRYVTVNQAYANCLGYTPEEMIGMLWMPTVHPDDLDTVIAAYEKMLKTGKGEAEARGIRQDGSMFYKQVVMVSAYDEQKQLIGHYCFMKDISDRKQAAFALERQFQQQQLLNRVMQAIRNSLDLKAIFNTAATGFTQLFSADGAYIVQYLSERKIWQIVAEYHQDSQAQNRIGLEIPDEANPIAEQLKQLETVVVSDTNTIADEVNQEIAKIFPGSWLMIPLTVGGVIWGCLNLYRCQTNSANQDGEIELARAVADQLAIAIQQANLYQKLEQELSDRKQVELALQRQAEQKEVLNRVIQTIRNSLDLNAIFQTATAEIAQLFSAEESYITQYFPERQIWRVLAGHQENPEIPNKTGLEIPDIENPVNVKLKKLEIFQISDANNLEDELNKQLAQICPGSWLVVPLKSGESLWGSLNLLHSQTNIIWDDEQVELARAVAEQLAIAIQQANLYQQLQQELSDRKQTEIQLQKAKEAAETANVAKSTFLANMSHELRTPLNAILGFTQMMGRDRTLSPQQQEQIKIINNAGDHLLALINDILEMSKIEAGRTSFNPTSFDLINFLTSLEELFKLKAESKGLQLKFELAPDLPQYVQTDEGKLRQVLINILGNAIKFTEKGQVILRAKQIAQPPLDDQLPITNYQLSFEIEDTGLGIEQEEIGRIFDPFIQSETGKKAMQGTGLGLAISRKFVKMMGGNIRVDSQPKKGSVFTFEIQVTPTDTIAQNTTHIPGQIVGLAPNQPEYRILVVEDHPESSLLLITLFSSIGFQIRQAANGKEAVSIWSTWKPHLICMDIRMPVIDGIQATQQIRARENELLESKAEPYDRTIIIALTANAFDADKNLALSAGCDDFISKPLQQDIVLQKIGQYLEINYIYETENHPSANPNPSNVAIKTTIDELKKYLAQMPEDWLLTLHDSAYIGDDTIIIELLKQIPKEFATLAKTLADLNHNFEFDKIIELTQK